MVNGSKHIVCVGASGYGNVGDDIYPQLWRAYFPDVVWSFVNSDAANKAIPSSADLVLFGGGGLIYNNETAHLEYMTWFIAEAKRLGIPFGFLSADLQVRRVPGEKNTFDFASLKPWYKLLKQAAFISVRSRRSQDHLIEHDIVADFVPDLAYLFRPGVRGCDASVCSYVNSNERGKFLAISGGRVKAENATCDLIVKRWEATGKKDLCVVNMGGKVGDDVTALLHAKLCEMTNTAATLYNSCVMNPLQALSLINNAVEVVTGRYHGLILSRNCNTPVCVPQRMQYKLEVESSMYDGDPYENILKLRQILSEL